MPVVLESDATTVEDLVDRTLRECSIDNCQNQHLARGYCNRHYRRWRKHGDPEAPYQYVKETVRARFFRLAEIRDEWECWNWTGDTDRGGYGRMSGGKRGVRLVAHRWAHEHFVGPIPKGLVIDHVCRNRKCVNPSHLEPVSHAENMRRARLDKRCRRGHERTDENTYIEPNGARRCRECRNATARENYAEGKQCR